MDAIDYMPHLNNRGTAAREHLKNEQIAARNMAYEIGQDPKYLTSWTWPQKGLLERNRERLHQLTLGK
jgi:xylulose-5-phosphate/fructose-6-phosphate phosphoketolase